MLILKVFDNRVCFCLRVNLFWSFQSNSTFILPSDDNEYWKKKEYDFIGFMGTIFSLANWINKLKIYR